MAHDRFDELIGRLLDDDISSDQLDELAQVAAADPLKLQRLREHLLFSDRLSQYEDELRDEQRFLSALQVRAHAADDTADFVSQVVASVTGETAGLRNQGPSPQSQHHDRGWSRFRGLAGWATAAAALLLLAAMLISQAIDAGKDEPWPQIAGGDLAELTEVNDSGVAVLTRIAGLQETTTSDWRVGETIPRGTMAWDAGLLQLEFYGGATVVVEGPAQLELLDESRVTLQLGRLWAHIPIPARGFAVLAPSFELVDVGTEFGLNVSRDGVAEIHVFDGKVELYDLESNRNQTTRRELNAGDALTIDRDGTSKPIEAQDADFVTPTRLSQMADVHRQGQLRDWQAFRDTLQDDPRIVAYFPFDRSADDDRLLIGYGPNGSSLTGAIVGCEWSQGRWPGKTSLQFKRPGDRVRISIPGEFESLTYSTWLRVDGLDRQYNSLLLTDGFRRDSPHWQILQDGTLILGMRHSNRVLHGYRSDSIFSLFRLGQWVHLATVYDSGQGHVTHYVNGERTTREPLKGPAFALLTIGDATIGNWSVPTNRNRRSSIRNLNGCMDELIVFGQALDDHEVHRIYEVGRP
ncbi:FecR protein [Stieleria neptunia]|uniref:FecR protein n=1 Tax=Stieleria neptunia TaxID=2527979 RepID=A0A518HK03_9BACT|nr:LamG domain-containing protein [Stieleria neptunia]QDV41151.1 FecR protein [Stieleria neptunia]